MPRNYIHCPSIKIQNERRILEKIREAKRLAFEEAKQRVREAKGLLERNKTKKIEVMGKMASNYNKKIWALVGAAFIFGLAFGAIIATYI